MKDKLVIFDCFGVILDRCAPFFYQKHCDDATAKTLLDKYTVPVDLGEISREEYFARLAQEFGMTTEDVFREWNELVHVREDVVEEIKKIRQKADVALLSNAASGFVEDIFDKNGLTALFDRMVVSSAVKMIKPDLAIYRYCVDSFQKTYQEVYMVDDTWANLEHLDEIGIIGVHFRNTASLQQIRL